MSKTIKIDPKLLGDVRQDHLDSEIAWRALWGSRHDDLIARLRTDAIPPTNPPHVLPR